MNLLVRLVVMAIMDRSKTFIKLAQSKTLDEKKNSAFETPTVGQLRILTLDSELYDFIKMIPTKF